MADVRKPYNAFNALHPEATDLVLYVRTEARSKPHSNSRGTLCLDLSRTDVCMTRGHRATCTIDEAAIVCIVDLESTADINKLSATYSTCRSSKINTNDRILHILLTVDFNCDALAVGILISFQHGYP